MADPNPEEPIGDVHGQCPIREPYASGPEPSDFLEVQGGMRGIFLQPLKVPISQLSDMGRKVTVMLPESTALPNGSKLSGLPRPMLPKGLVRQEIEPPGFHILFNPTIPSLGLTFEEPTPETR
jgi:hypothetical protein